MLKKGLIFIVLVSVLGCKKKDGIQFTISGKINDTSLNGGLSGASITLYKVKAGTTEKVNVMTVSSASDGTYELKFDRDESEKYYVDVEKDNYFPVEETIYFSSLSTNAPYTENIDVEAIATIKWVIVNQAPQNPTDLLKLQKVNGKTDCDDCCPNTFYYYSGPNIDTTLVCQTKGNTWVKFYIINQSTNPATSEEDSVYCTAFQTTTYNVNY